MLRVINQSRPHPSSHFHRDCHDIPQKLQKAAITKSHTKKHHDLTLLLFLLVSLFLRTNARYSEEQRHTKRRGGRRPHQEALHGGQQLDVRGDVPHLGRPCDDARVGTGRAGSACEAACEAKLSDERVGVQRARAQAATRGRCTWQGTMRKTFRRSDSRLEC